MQKWEYKIVSGSISEKQLNQLGEDGWNLVAGIAAGLAGADTIREHPPLDAYSTVLYFKRPKQ